jgi:hypothetical protein
MKPSLARALALAAVVAALVPAAASARPFSPTSFWNTPLPATSTLDGRSNAWVAHLADKVKTYGPWINTTQWSVPVYDVPANQAVTKVWIDTYAPQYQSDFYFVPIPADATPAAGADRHMVINQASTDSMWEFWGLYKAADGWHAGAGGKLTSVSNSNGSFPNVLGRLFPSPYGATATGLALEGGLITPDELAQRNIDHVVALAIPKTLLMWYFLGPAVRSDGDSSDPCDVPEGARFRLPASLNISALNLSPVAATIARAVQKYGMVVRDRSGSVSFYGQDPKTMASNPYPALYGGKSPDQVLAGFPWGQLQALAGTPNVALPTPTGGLC